MTTKRKWSAKIDTDSTHPDQGLFKKSPSAIAKALASKKVSPKGPGSGMRMLTFYINRAGKNLPASRKQALTKAKTLLSEIIAEHKEKSGTHRLTTKKSTSTKASQKRIRKNTTAAHTKKAA